MSLLDKTNIQTCPHCGGNITIFEQADGYEPAGPGMFGLFAVPMYLIWTECERCRAGTERVRVDPNGVQRAKEESIRAWLREYRPEIDIEALTEAVRSEIIAGAKAPPECDHVVAQAVVNGKLIDVKKSERASYEWCQSFFRSQISDSRNMRRCFKCGVKV